MKTMMETETNYAIPAMMTNIQVVVGEDAEKNNMNNKEEIWKTVEGYNGLYEISSFGRIRSKASTLYKNRNKPNEKEEYVIKNPTLNNKYYTTGLFLNGKLKRVKIHRLVAFAFIPNPENKPHVNHINGIKTDNRVENLEWCTHSENMIHAYKTGLQLPMKGKNHPSSKSIKIFKNGIYVTTLTGKEELKNFGLNPANIFRYFKKIVKHHKGYTFEKVN